MSVIIEGVVLVGITLAVTIQTIRGKINWQKVWEKLSHPSEEDERLMRECQRGAEQRDRERFNAQMRRDDLHLRSTYPRY